MKTSPLSRRRMIASTAAGIAGLGAVAVSALNRNWFTTDARGGRSWWNGAPRSLAQAGMDEWSRHIGSSFEIQGESGASTFKLVSVEPLNSTGARPAGVARDRAFLAVFDSGSGGGPAGNRTYTVRHIAGSLDVFFDPSDASAATARLHAVFN